MTDKFSKIDDSELAAEVARRLKHHGEKRTHWNAAFVREQDARLLAEAQLRDATRHLTNAREDLSQARQDRDVIASTPLQVQVVKTVNGMAYVLAVKSVTRLALGHLQVEIL